MAFTSRPTSGRMTPNKGLIPQAPPSKGAEFARAMRVEELRRLVAAGRYEVEPRRLAVRILARALRHG